MRLLPPFLSPTRLRSPIRHSSFNPISMANQSIDSISLSSFPKPLSPPLPAISKTLELNRALSAEATSSRFNLSRNDVVFEDEWLIVVNKPQGVYCERVLASLPDILQNSTEGKGALELHLANRLDRDTSGVMIVTKMHKVAAKLVKVFTEHKVRKTYVALCVGVAPEWESVKVKSGHGRSKFGAWRVYAASDVGRGLPGGSMVRDMETRFEVLAVNGERSLSGGSGGREAEERFVVVEEKSEADCSVGKDEVLVRASPRSGRTHQIRLHCQYLGIPIRGDVKYEGVHEWKGVTYNGHELHAESLALDHPVTGTPMMFHAPLPSWASDAVQSTT